MFISRYDLYIGIGIGAVSVIVLILIATTIFCKCFIPSSSHRYFGRSTRHYAAVNNIDAKTYFKPPQHLIYAPIVHRIPQPPVITQDASSSHSARTSVASGGRLSILSEKLSRLSLSSIQSGRPSVASDSVLLQKKCEGSRMSHSYDDTDTQAIAAHYSGRRSSKAPRLSTTGTVDPQIIELARQASAENARNIRFELFPRTTDVVEQSISSLEPSTSVIAEEQPLIPPAKRQLTSGNSIQSANPGQPDSSVRSPPLSKSAAAKYAQLIRQGESVARASMPSSEQSLLSPPLSRQSTSHLIKTKTLRGALGAIMPNLYFVDTACTGNVCCNNIHVGTGAACVDRPNDESSGVGENPYRLHIRIQYDDHRNDLLVHVIEAQCLPLEQEEYANPYVKLYLRPPVDQKLRQTSVQPQTINPCWNEYFKFGVPFETVLKTTKTLHFCVYNYAHSSRPECIGEAQIRLTAQTIHGCDLWCPINKQRAEDEYLGELLVSITYLAQAERLNVGIIEARNLKALSMHIEADPVVRLSLQLGQTDKVKRKKTSVKRNTVHPKWNEEISFNIPGVSLADSCLEIGVYHHDLIAPDEPLGFLRFENTMPIGNANIAQHSEIIHWCEVINGEQRAACWHLLRKAARAVPLSPSSSNQKLRSPSNAVK